MSVAAVSAKWKPYPAYKPSGVDWLGDIPAHWEVKRLKYLFTIVNGSTPKSSESQYWDGDIPWVTPDDLGDLNGVELKATARSITELGYQSCGTTLVPAGSLVLSTRAPIGHLAIAAVPLCTNQGCRSLVFRRPQLRRFFYYQVFAAHAEFESLGQGSTFKELASDKLASVRLDVPPNPEQEAIAAFLGRETAKIDALVGKEERLIDRLQEKRATLITYAVTKGLNPSASMKDSGGVEWLGQIPAHWEAKRLPFVVSVQEGPGIMASDFLEDGVPLLRIGNLTQGSVTLGGCNFLSPEKVESRWRHFRLEEGDLLISGSASTGQVSFVDSAAAGSIAYTGIFRLRPVGGNVLKEFVAYFVGSAAFLDQVNTLRTGVGIQHYGPKHLRSVWVPLPPFQEQLSIREVLDVETGKIDALIARVRKGIERLKEYRAAVISAAVTGKIDVREAVG